LTIRPFSDDDIELVLAQAVREQWTTSRAWLAGLFEHDPGGCFIAELHGKAAGMVTTTCHGETAWIGYLIVLPECRRRGIGRMLMEHAMQRLQDRGIRTMRLDADPPGIKIYRSLGFEEEWESRRFRLESALGPAPTAADRLPAGELDAVCAFDLPRFGDDRSRMIRLWHRAAEASFCIRNQDGLAGYTLVHATTTGMHIGPCAAVDRSAARGLILRALEIRAGRPVTAGVPAPNGPGARLLMDLGFVETPSSTRMVWGVRHGSGMPHEIFAIAHGAVG